MSNVRRVYVEKKPDFAVQAKELKHEIGSYLGIKTVTGVRVLIRYDVENLSDEIFQAACRTVFSEPPVDVLFQETFGMEEKARIFSVEYLPGQFDQRADSAVQCVKFLKEDEEPIIHSATTYVIEGDITEEEFQAIKNHCINPVDSRETDLTKPETLVTKFEEPSDVIIFDGFAEMEEDNLKELYASLNLAMTFKDFQHIQNYFREVEKRDPSMTEIRVLDTYWSDHCRHTTFSTELKKVTFGEGEYKEPIVSTYKKYLADREEIFKGREDKFVCLMDLALMAMRKLKAEGKLQDQEESDEINACSIVVPVDVDGKEEEWLINFKNETHNHPTEIEPFGGAATCLGGAIRDPLSGRTYVYQAMRVTGAADPTVSVKDTLKGKLPQKKLVRGAAKGYSSYGNQIGLATGYVKEIYHPDYVAKRMEIGAVLGAAPRRAVIRENSDPGDIIILLGGRTGRDGCGGATGSSKVHTEESIETCGAEVQKGNAPTERKIQRLFRREEVSCIIKKCNDFGAGGVSVAIGELADGLQIYLDKVPKKYAGLDGTEISISESQERMAVVVDPKDVEQFLEYAREENLEAVEVAVVTESPRLVMIWRDKEIVNISRAFLDTNGAHQETEVYVDIPGKEGTIFRREEIGDVKEKWLHTLADLNTCSQKGLVEMFDGSIGAGSVFMPYGGKYQLTETQAMVAKVPVQNGKTNTVTMMSYGFDPYLSSWSPYHGAVYAVVESVARIVAAGGDYRKIRFTFQEYFRRMTEDPSRWSQPFAALLGAYAAQMGFGLPSIGGKDSMSGTFNEIDVPPTLVSFAVNVAKQQDVITPELKTPGSRLIWVRMPKGEYDLPDYTGLMEQYQKLHEDIQAGRVLSAYALDRQGIAAAVSKMAFGNKLGVKIEHSVDQRDLFAPGFGDIICEVKEGKVGELGVTYTLIGEVKDDGVFRYANVEIPVEEALRTWTGTLEKVFPSKATEDTAEIENRLYDAKEIYVCRHKTAMPTVFIPVFPGTNCEYDSKKAFERAGAQVVTKVFKNLNAEDIRDSVRIFEKAINQAQIIMFPGGFSAGDEPDGSAKFFATAFQNEKIREAVMRLLNERDGLALGICNGFQALIKLGLVPYGKITGQTEDSPTLTYNTIGRHISKMVYTKVVTNKSPWLQKAELGKVYTNPASHGEGRFVAGQEWIDKLFANGQVATQYCDLNGSISMDEEWNVNGSYAAIEGITSPDGRVLGKMAHSERRDDGVAINIYGEQDIQIFESGVAYFK
ncbi:phosphoribosylformylglycinamidine synthase [Lactonifactor sp. BIOML-A3]|uniref:phosphoribosylformylglycinamidine synthase n=1 Tax=unclassified Lactonifactor TaxID=2636670 RepID=UPI0012B0F3CA|nr:MULTISPECIES: phosphoribosylformylglycinamidine synthase [unclassified Lactonifactor]MSA02968.1 phosphoribosylformylglycinamidine synthase [Lactonifactor sp. BIOML-A5]MSA09259.1 phosphoribosylformylglycinamidine synthase [Lactonifactor sp. BIOML-A4]MSA13670.1 phosphoribosylformylglycinamidine synthase [Lactonifactor sp. BIOML-A3]MSA18252.1 phosphoribosylformylglycinamidine synthase [Lactonifactor sp. BIOML-A2]MSA39219.1 phosphoribosylformylglycinamidine synthase [Lactonifactor sp. BIOML-A1]